MHVWENPVPSNSTLPAAHGTDHEIGVFVFLIFLSESTMLPTDVAHKRKHVAKYCQRKRVHIVSFFFAFIFL